MKYFDMDEKIINIANYILEKNTTIRATAQAFNIPKSTIHHHLSKKLKLIDYPLYIQVKNLMEKNFNNKHIHGGESTKQKYIKLKLNINKNDEMELFSF